MLGNLNVMYVKVLDFLSRICKIVILTVKMVFQNITNNFCCLFSASVLFAWERSPEVISFGTCAEVASQFSHSTQL